MRIEVVRTEAVPDYGIVSDTAMDPCNMTLAIHGEDHTLGNALRYIIMKNPAVELCAYTIPHPSEAKIHFCIQTNGDVTALDAMYKGLDDLMAVTKHCAEQLVANLAEGGYEVDDGSKGTTEC